jgi:hypothetical protein
MNLEELLAKLDAQNFGQRDSVVASTINHPVNAIGKLLSSIQNRVNIASNPNIPDALKVQSTLDLAGGAQLGSMPFAPSGAGTLGSIKYLYHATPTNNLQSIAKIGVKPSKEGYEGPGVYFSKLKTGGEGYDFSLPEYSHLRVDAKTMKDIFGSKFKGSLTDAVQNDYSATNDVRIDSPIPIPAQYFEVEQDGIWKALNELLDKKKGP